MNITNQTRVADLRKMAEEAEIPGYEDMDKADLIKALKALDSDNDESETEEDSDTESEDESEQSEETTENEDESSSEPASSLDFSAPVVLGSKAHKMRDFLKKQKKVRIMVPLATGEKRGVTQSVILNGWPIYIRKGEYVDVPEAVADVLEAKMKHEQLVEDHPNRVGGDREVKMSTYGG